MSEQRGNIFGLLNHGGRPGPGHHPPRHGGGARRPVGAPPHSPPARGSDQERYVTSAAIESVRKKVDTDLKKFFADLKGYVDDTDIPFPGWGVLGSLLIGFQYSRMQDDVRAKADNGHESAEAIATALGTVRDNWRKAEDASTVVYQ